MRLGMPIAVFLPPRRGRLLLREEASRALDPWAGVAACRYSLCAGLAGGRRTDRHCKRIRCHYNLDLPGSSTCSHADWDISTSGNVAWDCWPSSRCSCHQPDAADVFAAAENNHVDNIEDSLAYYIALKKAGVPVETHLYAHGGMRLGGGQRSFR
jgi:hypothetical protein